MTAMLLPTIAPPTVSEMLTGLRRRGYHPMLMAAESGKHAWVAYVRGGQDVGGETPDAALMALVAQVESKTPPTTRELRRAGT